LFIDQDSTAAASQALEIDTEGGDAISLLDLTTTGNGLVVTTAASYTGQVIKIDDTLVGTANEGIIDVHTTANMAQDAALVRLDADTGTVAVATSGYILDVDDDSGAQATSYAVQIDSANNEALLVSTGVAVFTEQSTHTAGVDCDGDIDADFSVNTEEVSVTSAANDYAAGSGIQTIYDDSTGQTNASYLMRLAREANGDAQDHFILCEDNSDGTAGNGDDMFMVDSGGVVTAAGNINANGSIIGDGATQLIGITSGVSANAANDTLLITDANLVITNTGAGGLVINTLPEASTALGCIFRFAVTAAQQLNINPADGTDQILGLTNAAGDSVQSNAAGDYIALQAVGNDSWVVIQTNNSTNNADGWADAN
jgi:hypothetical protein